MTDRGRRSWLDQLTGVAAGILLVAVLLYVAVLLLRAIATALLVITGVGLLVTLAIAWVRGRRSGW